MVAYAGLEVVMGLFSGRGVENGVGLCAFLHRMTATTIIIIIATTTPMIIMYRLESEVSL